MCLDALKVQGLSVWPGNTIKDFEKKIFSQRTTSLYKREWKAHVKHSIHEPQRSVGGDYDQIGPQCIQMKFCLLVLYSIPHSLCLSPQILNALKNMQNFQEYFTKIV